MLCVLILYMNDGTYSLKSSTNDRFLRNFPWQFFIHPQNFCQISAESKSPKQYFFCISFEPCGGAFETWGDLNPGFTSNKTTFYLLAYNDDRDRFHVIKISMNAYA